MLHRVCRMRMTFVAPIGMITLSLTSALIYGVAGDWRRAIYWAAASVLAAAVTF